MMLFEIVEMIVNSHHDIERFFFDRSRDDDFFDALIEIGIERLRGAELGASDFGAKYLYSFSKTLNSKAF